jgi:diguanylate cyclase (GGDEF)-like protein
MGTLVAGLISLFFTWHITKLRLGMEISANMLEEERNKYMDQSTIDELTKLKNRRDFMQTFKRYLSNYRTNDDWLCVSICDIDFFKLYNDHYGHPMGDDCLRSVGRVLTSLSENMNVYAARVGGEEFALLWFEKDAAHANEVVSTMSKMIRDMKIPHEKSKVHEFVTMSIGVYIEKCGASNDAKALYELADNALYTAKGSGRNCAIITGREIAQYKLQ